MTTLIKRIDGQHVIINRHTTFQKYVVCCNYDPNAPEGFQWDWGHYFDTLLDAVTYAKGQGYFEEIRRKLLNDLQTIIERKQASGWELTWTHSDPTSGWAEAYFYKAAPARQLFVTVYENGDTEETTRRL